MPASKSAGAKSRERSKADPSFNIYIGKILKKKHDGLTISKGALRMVNGVAEDALKRLVENSGRVAGSARKSTLSSRHVQAAARVMLPCELAKAAVANGTAAVVKFVRAS